MMARWLFVLSLFSLTAGSGCCCYPTHGMCGGYGGSCCFCMPKPIVWDGSCNECGPRPGVPCGPCWGDCGILPWLVHGKSCGKGCGEIYWGEWISDPPDCCDPCDQCTGCWTGRQGYCYLGPFQRLLAALHGYRYCPPPHCGPSCGPLCRHSGCGPCGGACGPVCGCDHCGGAGCTTCGGPAHGASIYYEGPEVLPEATTTPSLAPQSILQENWDIPKPRVEPGKPIHNAQQPRGQMTRRPAAMSPQRAGYMRQGSPF